MGMMECGDMKNNMIASIFNRKGFTLVEVLVCMAILSIIIISFTAAFSTSFTGISKNGENLESLYGKQKNIEYSIKDYNSIDAPNDSDPIQFGSIPGSIPVPMNGIIFNETVSYDNDAHQITISTFVAQKN